MFQDPGACRCCAPVRLLAAVTAAAGLALLVSKAAGAPPNDACAAATPITTTATGTVVAATPDGASSCTFGAVPDVYHLFTPSVTGTYTFTLCAGASWDTAISIHSGCPATTANQIACDDDGCRPPGSTAFGLASSVAADLTAGTAYRIRVSGYDTAVAPGPYTLSVVAPQTPMGACCNGTSCSIQTWAACLAGGGSYRGDFTACQTIGNDPVILDGAAGVLAIPDNQPQGISTTINVPDVFTVADVRLDLTINHSHVGDLKITLTHAGQTATLMDRVGGGTLGDDSNLLGQYIFSDGAFYTFWQGAVAQALTSSTNITNTAYRAVDAYGNTVSFRAIFAGLPAAGPWTLTLSDNGEFATGALGAWRLTVDRAVGNPCDNSSGACCFGSGCHIAPNYNCFGAGRRWAGPGTICNVPGNRNAPCCQGDFSQNGVVGVQDIFDFLAAYFAGDPAADTNGGGLSVQDIFDFLSGYFQGC